MVRRREVRAAEQVDVAQIEANSLNQRIADDERNLHSLVESLRTGVAVSVVSEKLRAQEQELAELQRRRAGMMSVPKLYTLSDKEIRAYAVELRDKLTTGSFAVKRWVVQQVIERVDVGRELAVTFKPPSVAEPGQLTAR